MDERNDMLRTTTVCRSEDRAQVVEVRRAAAICQTEVFERNEAGSCGFEGTEAVVVLMGLGPGARPLPRYRSLEMLGTGSCNASAH